MKKRILYVFTAFSLALSPVSATAEHVPVADDIVVYDNIETLHTLPCIDTAYLSEADSPEAEIVMISTADEFITFRDNVNSDSEYSKNKIFKLTNSIDLGGIEWIPIGYNSSYQLGDDLSKMRDLSFRGVFDGQGYTISNFKMTDEDLGYLGLFGTIHLGTVQNLNIADAYIDYNGKYSSQISQFSGLLAAFSNYATFTNCNVSGSIKIANDVFVSSTTIDVGMISGAGFAKITDCNAIGNISVSTLVPPYVGGILGFGSPALEKFDASITECTSDVTMDVKSISGICVGGIVGIASEDFSEISKCKYSEEANLNITANQYYSSENLNLASVYLGGIAGVNCSTIKNCSVGDITLNTNAESAPTVGGIAGKNDLEINQCSSSADISVTLTRSDLRSAATPAVGGITGTNGANYNSSSNPALNGVIPVVKNCSIGSDVSINITSDSGAAAVAGFISGITYAPAEIVNCVSYASDMKVKSSNAGVYAGGICGHLDGGAVRYCGAEGAIGENISAATSIYIGGIAGDTALKYFYTYDDSFGITSPLFTVTKFYGAVIEDCYSNVDITAKNSNRIYAGGICGYFTNAYIEDNKSYYINASRENAISRCSATGNITVTPTLNTFIGGAIGYSVDGRIYNTHSSGTVTVTKDGASVYSGGFLGAVYQNGHNHEGVTATVDNCYTTSNLILPENASKLSSGAFIARVVPSATTQIEPKLTSCYYLENGAQTEYDGLSAIHAEQLCTVDIFENWDFDETWTINDEKPVLRFEKTGVYKYSSDANIINSLLITRVPNNSKLFAITYMNGSIVNTQVYDINDSNYINEYFQQIDCEIKLSESTVTNIYIWGGDDCMEPLCEVYSL